MKLNLITEVFDRPNLDGVTMREMYGSVIYEFKDGASLYSVEIMNAHIEDWLISQLANKVGQENMAKLNDIMETFGHGVAIYLEEAGRGYRKTGQGNQWFVYGKVLASMTDYIQREKPVILQFSGVTSDMDLVYDRFIKMSRKIDPSNSYSFYAKDVYVHDKFKQYVEELASDNVSSEQATDERNRHLSRAKRLKNMDRPSNYRANR